MNRDYEPELIRVAEEDARIIASLHLQAEQIARVFSVPAWLVDTSIPRPGRFRQRWSRIQAAAHERVGRIVKRAFNPTSSTGWFWLMFAAQFVQYGLATLNIRATAQANSLWTLTSDALLAANGFIITKRIVESKSKAGFVGYILGGMIGTQIMLYITKILLHQ